jgi:peptidoglycan LD-endopeptidase CwlK
MPRFGKRSLDNLATCHPDLRRLAAAAIGVYDFTVTEGHRSDEDQQRAFDAGLSQKKPGESKHNRQPSEAMHCEPHPIDQQHNLERYWELAGVIEAYAHELGIEIVWGGHWPHLRDLAHYELKESTP